MARELIVWYQVKHSCGHTSKMQCLHVGGFDEIKQADVEPAIARLEALPCRSCWVQQNVPVEQQRATGTWFVDIPKGL